MPVGAMATPGALEEPGHDGATLCMGGYLGWGAGEWGAVQSGWKRVWCEGESAQDGLGKGWRVQGGQLPGLVASAAWESLPVLPSVPQAPLCLARQGALSLLLASRQV